MRLQLRLFSALLLAGLPACALSPADPDPEPAPGDSCSKSSDCGEDMKCIGAICVAPDPVPDGSSDGAGDVLVTPEPDSTGLAATDSNYTLTITMMDGFVYEVERDLEGKETAFSFGSSHIAPAVAFSMEDTITFPDFMIITMDFGKVVGSLEWPRHIYGEGSYPFTDGAPSFEILVGGLSFISRRPESDGAYEIEQFANQTGQVMSGTISGRIWHDKDDPIQYVDIECTFHFTLPEKGKQS